MGTCLLLRSLQNITKTSPKFTSLITNRFGLQHTITRQSKRLQSSAPATLNNVNTESFSRVKSLTPSEDGQFVTVTWQDGHEIRYPYLWLRDNCHCNHCYNPQTWNKKNLLKDMNLDAKLKFPEYKSDGSLVFHGTDGHEIIISSSWLRESSFGEIHEGPTFTKIDWSSDLMSYLPKFKYDDVLNDDNALYEWMKCIKIYGLSWITGAPIKDQELRNIADRIGHLRQTFYGTIFGINAKENTYFPGYTPQELALHTDYTFGYNTPGVFMLHGIERAPIGGESRFVDGFKLANDLKKLDPVAFELLCTGVMSFGCTGFDCGRHFDNRSQSRVISTDRNGSVNRISYSEHVRRDGLANIPLEDIPSFYRALKKFATMIYSPEYLLQTMIKEGDIVTLDNYRVLHGRTDFQLQPGRGRHVQGAYFDIDEFESRFRILSQQLKF